MKKKILLALGLTGIIAGSVTIGAYAASDIKLLINGKSVAADIQIVDGSSYVPLRVVSESLGADVKWDGDARTISILQKGFNPDKPNAMPAKSFDVNINVESGPMRMSITKVTLDPSFKDKYSKVINAIILDVKVENTTNDSIGWSLTSDKIVLNTKEQIDRASFTSDSVGGEFAGKVVKEGKIIYEAKSDLSQVSSINLSTDGAFDYKTYKAIGQKKMNEIILK